MRGSLIRALWFFSFLSSYFGPALSAPHVEKIAKGQVFHLLGGQADFFLIFVIVPLVGAVALGLLSKTIVRLMAGATA